MTINSSVALAALVLGAASVTAHAYTVTSSPAGAQFSTVAGAVNFATFDAPVNAALGSLSNFDVVQGDLIGVHIAPPNDLTLYGSIPGPHVGTIQFTHAI